MKNSDLGSWKVSIKKAAGVAWRKSSHALALRPRSFLHGCALWLILIPTNPAFPASDTSAAEGLRDQIFHASLNKPGCANVKVGPRGQSSLPPQIDELVNSLRLSIQTKDAIKMQPLFHPRLNQSLVAIKTALTKIESNLGGPLDVSIYRLWALNTVDGSTRGLECAGDGVTVYPHYGYSLQFGLWLQVMGQKEIGRIFATIVPVENKWYLGSFQSQQWTHAGKDPIAWFDQAAKLASQSGKVAAYLTYDVTSKLLDVGTTMTIDGAEQAIKERDKLMNKDQFLTLIQQSLPSEKVVYAASILVTDGIGISARVRVPGEVSLVDMKQRCRKMADTIGQQTWATSLKGVRCAFLLPPEKPDQDGALGSLYMSFRDT